MSATLVAAILAPILSALFVFSLVAGLAYYHICKRKADDKKRRAQRQSQRERSRSSQISLPLQEVPFHGPQPQQTDQQKVHNSQPQPDIAQIV